MVSDLQCRVYTCFFYKGLTLTEIGNRLSMLQRKGPRTIASVTGALRDLLRNNG